jgi:NAD(P)-dependent dehydrogenase (short-subunit alcohol dehydrogenase family)
LEVKHGLELQFLTNHVGHFILVTGLLDRLAPEGRVTMLSSAAHTSAPRGGIDFDNLDGAKGYSAWSAYGRSKLANLLFAKALARRFAGSRRVANAVHPGVIATNLGRHMPSWGRAVLGAMEPLFLKSIPEGAATQTWAAVHPAAAEHNGEYLADCNVARASAYGRDTSLATRLWEETEALVARM